MSPPPLHLVVLIGSTRQGRLAPIVAAWFADRAEQRAGLTLDVIDLADLRLPEVLGAEPGPDVAALGARLAAADAFVIVTPEYNRSFPAPLKNAIDWYATPWRARPVGFVSYGGASGGLRAVEQLRQVFSELHAVSVQAGVSFHGVWSQFDAGGRPHDPTRCNKAAEVMLDQLTWWGRALREAREKSPYAA
jgi:NAD(P)H-dependent FMN reductase